MVTVAAPEPVRPPEVVSQESPLFEVVHVQVVALAVTFTETDPPADEALVEVGAIVYVQVGTVTAAAVTVTLAVARDEPILAVMLDWPAATPVIRPLPFTVAMLVALELQFAATTFPLASVADSCTVLPTSTAALDGEILMTVFDGAAAETIPVNRNVIPIARVIPKPIIMLSLNQGGPQEHSGPNLGEPCGRSWKTIAERNYSRRLYRRQFTWRTGRGANSCSRVCSS
jgi:hypothetical protein